MLTQLASLRPGRNIRQIPPTPAERKAMRDSIEAQGVLQSLLCRPQGNDNHLEVVCGFQRYEAAVELGIVEVEIDVRDMTDEEVDEVQLAENLVRAAIHPVDVWRRVRDLAAGGRPLTNIAKSLGRDERDIRRWERLGRLAPEMLELAEIQMPSDSQLRRIASASPKQQRAVAKSRETTSAGPDKLIVHWEMIAVRCEVERIFQAHALFNTATAKITWEEDMFAADGADDQWYTTDIEKFRKAQYAALRERCAELGKRKPPIEARPLVPEDGRLRLPKGFAQIFTFNLEKPKRFEVQFHGMDADGSIEVMVAIDVAAQREHEKKLAERKKKKSAASTDLELDEDVSSDPPARETNGMDPAGRSPITQVGLDELAAMRTRAVQRALQAPMSVAQVMQLLLVSLACENVAVSGEGFRRERFDDLAKQMVEPGGNLLKVEDEDLVAWAREAIGRIVKFAGPKANGQWASGPWGEILGKAVRADDQLPRFDTKEFLERVNGEQVRELFTGYMEANPGVVHVGKKSVSAMRESLIGRLPDWRPSVAIFGAPSGELM